MDREITVIAFPLRGEWFTEVSPANSIPSHGTDCFGLRYAFDFIKVNWENPTPPHMIKRTRIIQLFNYFMIK